MLGLIVFGIVAIFASIPNSDLIYAFAGLGILGAFTIFDFTACAVPIPKPSP